MEKKLMLGNEAVARGVYEAGVDVVSSYPGTPSTEISENIIKHGVYAEWAPNEKVALEVAVGASIAGGRSMSCMKHVGLNVAADPLFTVAYTGVNGGLVIVVADDPGMHSSQNEQDSRFYARSSHIPMLEPSDSQEAKEFTKLAFELSEKYDTPVLLRLTTRVAHSQSIVDLCEPIKRETKPYVKDIQKNVMIPGLAKLKHVIVEARDKQIAKDSNNFEINKMIVNDTKLGVICSGVVYQYVKDVLPNASILKLGMVFPLPIDLIKEFAGKVDELMVIEELEPFFENQIKANGIKCVGKDKFSVQGEITASTIEKVIFGKKFVEEEKEIPNRPPVMCAGCPHRGIYYVLKKMGLNVTGDIGCYSLGAVAPLNAVDAVVCMGASVGMSHGFEKAKGREIAKNTVAVIGDSTFVHSGITGLINAVYNKGTTTLLILDNSTTGMTGHQDHPCTGLTLNGQETSKLNLIDLCKACGVKNVRVCDPHDLITAETVVREELDKDEVSVIIFQRPCVLKVKAFFEPYKISDKCKKCKMCMKLGCPAITNIDGEISINNSLCVGCGLCQRVCKFDAITR